MHKRPILLQTFLLTLLFTTNLFADTAFIDGDLEEARAMSAANEKPFIAYFSASWCMPCQWMEKNTFSDPKLGAFINEQFIAVKIDVDAIKGAAYQETYQVDHLPSILIFNSEGDLEERLKSSFTASQLQEALEQYLFSGRAIKVLDSPKPTLNLSRPALKPDVREGAQIVESQGTPEQEVNKLSGYNKQEDSYLDPAPSSAEWPPTRVYPHPDMAPRTPNSFVIQVGVYQAYNNAIREQKSLEKLQGKSVYVETINRSGKKMHKISIGTFLDRQSADAYLSLLRSKSIKGYVRRWGE